VNKADIVVVGQIGFQNVRTFFVVGESDQCTSVENVTGHYLSSSSTSALFSAMNSSVEGNILRYLPRNDLIFCKRWTSKLEPFVCGFVSISASFNRSAAVNDLAWFNMSSKVGVISATSIRAILSSF
jgi:hypothetical protein